MVRENLMDEEEQKLQLFRLRQSGIVLMMLALLTFSGSVFASEARIVHNIRTRVMAPYDLLKINYLGMNYLESTFSERMNLVAFAQDAPELYFIVDNARILSALVEEAEHSPVVRLELIKRITEGILNSEAPGVPGMYYFEHNARKINILDKSNTHGWLTQKWCWDMISPVAEIGFRVGALGAENMDFVDHTGNYGSIYVSESPVYVHRTYNGKIELIAQYYNGTDDRPLSIQLIPENETDEVVLYVGDGMTEIEWFRQSSGKYYVETAEEQLLLSRDIVFKKPNFNYLLLRKDNNGLGNADSRVLMIAWEGSPSEVGIYCWGPSMVTQVEIVGTGKQKIYILPFGINPLHTSFIKTIAENILQTGTMGMGEASPQRFASVYIPVGLAASGYILQKYNDPWASYVLAKAKESLDFLIESEKQGIKEGWLFHIVDGALYMIQAGYDEYEEWVDKWIDRMHSRELMYDSRTHTWPWLDYQIKNMTATYKAYKVLGKEKYLNYYNNVRKSIVIKEDGIHWKGQTIKYGSDDTTALLVGLFGYNEPETAQVILDNSGIYVNDYGMGPWGCSDINPKYAGLCLAQLGLSDKPKVFTNIGDFPIIVDGEVVLTRTPTVYFSEFPDISDLNLPVFDVPGGEGAVPGASTEARYGYSQTGSMLGPNVRFLEGEGHITYRFKLNQDEKTLFVEVGGDYKVEIATSHRGNWILIASAEHETSHYFDKREILIEVDDYFPGAEEVFVRLTNANPEDGTAMAVWRLGVKD